MYKSIYTSSEAFTKPSYNNGNYEYLKQFARRLLESSNGNVEIRDANGTLKASIWTEAGEVKEWENK